MKLQYLQQVSEKNLIGGIMKNMSARTIALLGVLFALVFVFLMIETFAFSAFFGNFTPAALTLPLAASISVTGKKWRMAVGGTLLGFSSFFLAMIISNVIFLNPFISILPRIFIGVTAYLAFLVTRSIFKNSESKFLSEILPYSVAGAVCVLTNTVLVISMLTVFDYASLAAVFTTIISINFVAEIIAAVILTPVFCGVINKVER